MNNNPELNWKTYESITKYIYEQLGKNSGVTILGYGNECRVKGSSGVEHQVDVLTSHLIGENEYKTAIECKYLNKKINKDIIMKLSAIITDAQIDQGIVVSKNGFTKDAKTYADHVNIRLVQLKEYTDNDIPELTNELHLFSIEIQTNFVIKRPCSMSVIAQTIEGKKLNLTMANRYSTFIESHSKRKNLFAFEMFFFQELHKTQLYKIIQKKFPLKDGKLCYLGKNEDIIALTFTGMLTRITNQSNRIFDAVDQIWLYMKSIFDDKSFIISENGYISEYIA